MFKDLAGAIWRRLPGRFKTWALRRKQTRFTVTAAAIVTDAQGRVLLLHHRFRPGSGWGIPGGFIEYGEQPSDAVRRELREEVGLELYDLQLLTTRAFRKAKQIEIVFCASARDELSRLSFEIRKAIWVHPQELPAELPPDQVRLIKRVFGDRARPPH